ncbi:hypothetical protein J2T60_001659 [Natronospira proteinivora]|uniref:Uncharacterized protein n=1 Tax=Natronospira proteinivora TaxID=1807133 RepID=A0ABT1G8N5_9GAMM|nr:hypothetical protein [Natronospira proteinivora]MCP1727659.1 hypothetical protein [Natronospira proteinivora]
MKKLISSNRRFGAAILLGATIAVSASVLSLDVPNQFQAGEPARADAVNENFQALLSHIESLETRIDNLEAELVDIEDNLGAVEDSDLFSIEDFLVDLEDLLHIYHTSPEDTAVQGPILRLTGANLQIINGSDDFVSDGTGNLVVGMATARETGTYFCSDRSYNDESDCISAGYDWSQTHNSGSHNIVSGIAPAYSGTYNIVHGRFGGTSGQANAIFGEHNISTSLRTIQGGRYNQTHASEVSILGGSNCEITSSRRWGIGSPHDLGECE